MKGISCETGDAFFIHRSHQTTIMPAEILFHVISDLIDPATDRKGNVMAKSHYQFAKRQKELAKKKKKEETKSSSRRARCTSVIRRIFGRPVNTCAIEGFAR